MHYLRYQYISQLVYLILALAESLGAPQYSVPEFFFGGGGHPSATHAPLPLPLYLSKTQAKVLRGCEYF